MLKFPSRWIPNIPQVQQSTESVETYDIRLTAVGPHTRFRVKHLGLVYVAFRSGRRVTECCRDDVIIYVSINSKPADAP